MAVLLVGLGGTGGEILNILREKMRDNIHKEKMLKGLLRPNLDI